VLHAPNAKNDEFPRDHDQTKFITGHSLKRRFNIESTKKNQPMTIEIEMPPELERQLNQAAEQAGVTPDMYVVHLVQQDLKQSHPHDGARRLPNDQAELLQRINHSLSSVEWQHYHELQRKRRAELLTSQEQAELIKISDQIEEINARRIQDLVELAQIRHTTVNDLIVELGLKPIPHA
jgi:hypothetical protein